MNPKYLKDNFNWEISKDQWKRAKKHFQMYGCGMLVPKPKQPQSKWVYNIAFNIINL